MKKPIILKDMGSFSFGGTVQTKENGDTIHGDHGYAQYFVPEDAYNYPIIMWHGMGQSGACWESTPERKDGFWQLFTREKWPVYIIDQNRRGRASYTYGRWDDSIPHSDIVDKECVLWTTFRYGFWEAPGECTVFEGTQQSLDPDAIDQLFRRQCMDIDNEHISDEYRRFVSNNTVKLLEQAGPSILFTHSNSAQYGWYTGGLAPDKVKGIFSYEPGHCIFPDDYEVPYITSPCQELVDELMQPHRVPREVFENLLNIPIRCYWGDYIRDLDNPSNSFPEEVWRINRERSYIFCNYINELGGDAKVLELPRIGITGNGHGGFAEKNNVEIFNQYLKDMKEAGLAVNDKPYQGPTPVKVTEYHIPIKL